MTKKVTIFERVNDLLYTDFKSTAKINWLDICCNKNLTKEFIKEFKNRFNKINYHYLFEYRNVPCKNISLLKDFIKDDFQWNTISRHQDLSEDFIREFQDKVNWFWISYSQNLSESFIREFQDKLDWWGISYYQKLSEDFIREFQDKVDWVEISRYQKLSESFISEFKDKVEWYYISGYQKISENFINKFSRHIDYTLLSANSNIILSKEFLIKNKDKINIFNYINNHSISIDELLKFCMEKNDIITKLSEKTKKKIICELL